MRSPEEQRRSSSKKADTGTNCPDGFLSQTNRGELSTGDYVENMNSAGCSSLVSNIILYWSTLKINGIVESLHQRGERFDDAVPAHISLLPYKHVLPNGTYFSRERKARPAVMLFRSHGAGLPEAPIQNLIPNEQRRP